MSSAQVVCGLCRMQAHARICVPRRWRPAGSAGAWELAMIMLGSGAQRSGQAWQSHIGASLYQCQGSHVCQKA